MSDTQIEPTESCHSAQTYELHVHCFHVPVRVLIVGLLCVGAFSGTMSRSSLTTTMIAMAPQRIVNHTVDSSFILSDQRTRYRASSNESDTCGYEQERSAWSVPKPPIKPEFDWTETQQDYLKGAFAIGYALALIPNGRLAEQHSGKLVASVGGAIHASLNLLTPGTARKSFYLLFALRVLLGVAGAALVPSFYCVVARWMPDNEKSKAIAALSVGTSLGNIFLNLMSGFLCEFTGWPSVFYLAGVLNLVWLAMWCLVASNRPEEHHFIGHAELTYIAEQRQRSSSAAAHIARPVPVSAALYARILTSPPVLATIFVKLAHIWFFTTLQAKLPQYMVAVLGMDIEQTSMWNTLFHLVLLISILITGCLADCASNNHYCNKTAVRKTFESISCGGVALCMILLTLNSCSRVWFVTVLASAVLFFGVSTGGSSTIVVDMTTHYAGTLVAILNTGTMLVGCLVPHLVTLLLGGRSDVTQAWHRVFYVSALFQAAGGLTFALFASARDQNWEKSAAKSEPEETFNSPSGLIELTDSNTSSNTSIQQSSSTSLASNRRSQ